MKGNLPFFFFLEAWQKMQDSLPRGSMQRKRVDLREKAKTHSVPGGTIEDPVPQKQVSWKVKAISLYQCICFSEKGIHSCLQLKLKK